MLLVSDNSKDLLKLKREPPKVGELWKEGDPVGSCILGYEKGPKNSYTQELAKKYPLEGK